MLNHNRIIKEIEKVEDTIVNVKNELKTLKNRVRAYKGWTKKYRKQQKALNQEVVTLKNDNQIVCRQRDRVNQELYLKQQELLKAVEEAKQAKELRDKALSQLDDIIAKIEQYKEVCDRANRITYADKIYLIQAAEKLFFDEKIINLDFPYLDEKEYPQMFTDQASTNRSLLNN
jgi:chromosome segregation ATPase